VAQRYWVERTFDNAKNELGMSDYQTRKWKSWQHHHSLIMLASLFIMKQQIDNQSEVPLLSFQYFKAIDASGSTCNFGNKNYYLDILDGKIEMDAGKISNSSDNTYIFLNFQYDTSLEEQMITVNVEYESPRMKLWQVDPSIYYWGDPSGLTGGSTTSTKL
jgi:hypothetical protein